MACTHRPSATPAAFAMAITLSYALHAEAGIGTGTGTGTGKQEWVGSDWNGTGLQAARMGSPHTPQIKKNVACGEVDCTRGGA